MRVAHSFMYHDRSQCPTPLRAGLLGPRVVSPHPQGLQGSHLNLSQTSAQRHKRYFLLNNKAVNLRAGLLGPRVVSPHPQGLQGSHLNLSPTSAQTVP